MNSICKEIFKAIHEGKWLSVEYKNKDENITRYWIAIKDIHVEKKSLVVDGLHLANYSLRELYVFIDSIISASIIDGSYYPINEALVNDIKENQSKYKSIFTNIVNTKILNYLADCNRMDSTPYKSEYALLKHFDEDSIANGIYTLSDEQYKIIISEFQAKVKLKGQQMSNSFIQLCLNVLSINTKKGLYVLAYKKLYLDVVKRQLIADETTTICTEFTIDGEKQSARMFLDADDFELLNNFDLNKEKIKDCITFANPKLKGSVDDLPYIMAIERQVVVDLYSEYSAILEMYENNNLTFPLQAFFGNFTSIPTNRKTYPYALINHKVNLDQLLSIHKAMKYPIAFIQGPPGTGKTNTIINTIATAYFNDKTVLFASYNNHPIDNVFDVLSTLQNNGYPILFPIIRLGNNEKVAEAIEYIKKLYEQAKKIPVYDSSLEKKRIRNIENTRRLTELLDKYDDILDLKERRKLIQKMLSRTNDLTLMAELQSRQLHRIEESLNKLGEISDDDAKALLFDDRNEFLKYLNFTSVRHIKKLGDKKYNELRNILYNTDKDKQVAEFNKYLYNEDNFQNFLEVFPIVVTTCISSHKLGLPKPYFDMTIIDEASQCNNAISLLPIIRGKNLMLVGDPQQLQPVILLDENTNLQLMKKYLIGEEYNYIKNSIYKTFIATDSISDEVLLSYHYRCNRKIIQFNNEKYYNKKLNIMSNSSEENPLVFVDITNNETDYKNTSIEECHQIVKYVMAHRDKSIGIITPFVNQKKLITEELHDAGIDNVTCGTVHAFQGDEKDIILFSLALTDKTLSKTYDWLKNNKELINVAVSRAKDKLVMFSSSKHLERLHAGCENDDLYELAQYIRSNGQSKVTGNPPMSRALGLKPYNTETEDAFLKTLNFALENLDAKRRQYIVKNKVRIADVFGENLTGIDLFYTGHFDFVIYNKTTNLAVVVFELDGVEHTKDQSVIVRDEKKKKICDTHNLYLVRVPNSYARRYNYVKDILRTFFK